MQKKPKKPKKKITNKTKTKIQLQDRFVGSKRPKTEKQWLKKKKMKMNIKRRHFRHQ